MPETSKLFGVRSAAIAKDYSKPDFCFLMKITHSEKSSLAASLW